MSDFFATHAIWGVLLTLAAYMFGHWISLHTGKFRLNALLVASATVILILVMSGIPYSAYRAANAPLDALLVPATVCLAVPLYEKRRLLYENLFAILASVAFGVIVSMGSVLLMAKTLDLPAAHTATLLPKSVTTAIGMDVAAVLGGIPSLAAAVIVLTGIIGNVLADGTCRLLKITDPVAKGIAIGTSAHAIGTARALEMGETEGAMSSLALGMAGILTALLAPFAAALLK